MRDKRIDYFSVNLKSAIKNGGYKVVDFPVKYLGCTYQSFNWRLQKGQFHTKDLYICLDMLNVTLEDLLQQVEIKKKRVETKAAPKEQSSSGGFQMLEGLIS